MRQLITLSLLILSGAGFAQNTGMIVGKVVENGSNNDPLIFAHVSLKNITTESMSDVTGLFLLENLDEGDYTLVCSFVGYDTKEINVYVNPLEPVEVNVALSPSTFALNELALLSDTIAKKEDKTSIAINN